MTSTTEDLLAKLQTASEVMGKLPVALLSQRPNAHYAENYNAARALALSLHPQLERVSPPAIAIDQDPSGPIARATFVEIVSYSTELANILKPLAANERQTRVAANIQALHPRRREWG